MTSEERERVKKQREVARRKAAHRSKWSKYWEIISPLVFVVILLAVVFGVPKAIEKARTTVNYGKGYNTDGTLSNYDYSNVSLFDYENISAKYSEIVSDDEIQAAIDEVVSGKSELKTSSDLTVADGDKIRLDYVGTVDGVEFEGGNTDGEGTILEIGSGSYIDNFEEQLIGTHPGEHVTVNVTFPEVYENNPSLAGKAAVFEVDVIGIYKDATFNDDFVLANFSDVASTAAEYRQYIADSMYDEEAQKFVENYMYINAEVASLPSAIVNTEKKILDSSKKYEYEYINSIYQNYYGTTVYESVYDYLNMSKSDYKKHLTIEAETTVTYYCIAQAIYNKAGLQYTEDDLNEALANAGYSESEFADAIAKTGEAYWNNKAIYQCVVNYLVDNLTVIR